MDQLNMKRVIATLMAHHNRQASLCNELEAIADALPSSLDNQHCLVIARQIFPIVQQAYQFEEETLFPILSGLPDRKDSIEGSLERLRFEHWEDESSAEELSETLRNFCKADIPENADKLSYMLRGFFDGLRRHLAFETEHLVPIMEANINRAFH